MLTDEYLNESSRIPPIKMQLVHMSFAFAAGQLNEHHLSHEYLKYAATAVTEVRQAILSWIMDEKLSTAVSEVRDFDVHHITLKFIF